MQGRRSNAVNTGLASHPLHLEGADSSAHTLVRLSRGGRGNQAAPDHDSPLCFSVLPLPTRDVPAMLPLNSSGLLGQDAVVTRDGLHIRETIIDLTNPLLELCEPRRALFLVFWSEGPNECGCDRCTHDHRKRDDGAAKSTDKQN